MARRWRDIGILIAKAAVTLAILGMGAAAIRYVELDFGEIFSHLRGMALWPLALAVGCRLVAVALTGLRWKVLLDGIDVPAPALLVISTRMVSEVVNWLIPGPVADVAGAYLLERAGDVRMSTGLAALVMGRIAGFLTSAALAVLLAALVMATGSLPETLHPRAVSVVGSLTVAVGAGLVVIVAVALCPRLLDAGKWLVLALTGAVAWPLGRTRAEALQRKAADAMGAMLVSVVRIVRLPRVLARAMLVSCGVTLAGSLILAAVCHAAGLRFTLLNVLFLGVLVDLSILLAVFVKHAIAGPARMAVLGTMLVVAFGASIEQASAIFIAVSLVNVASGVPSLALACVFRAELGLGSLTKVRKEVAPLR